MSADQLRRFAFPVALTGLALVALLLRLERAWADIPEIVLRTTSDDAYYYFKIARNIVDGRNVTFDGEHLTNGFHPLWLALITPVFAITSDAERALHLSLSIGAMLGAGTVVVIGATVLALTRSAGAALVAAGFYALHPYVVNESVNGVETSLAVFLLATVTLLFVRIALTEAPRLRDYVLLGVAIGFMVLARTDTIFVVIPVAAYLARRHRGSTERRRLGATAAVAFAVVAPWLIWMLVTFGTVVQVSGLAGPELTRRQFLDENGDAVGTQARHGLSLTREALVDGLPRLYLVPAGREHRPIVAAGAVLIAVMLVVPPASARSPARRRLLLLAMPAAGVAAALVYHAGIRWHVREWYFGPAGLMIALFLGVAVAWVEAIVRWVTSRAEESRGAEAAWLQPVAVVVLYAVVALALVRVYAPQRRMAWDRPLPHQVNMLETARWLETNTERDARIGSFNAGIIGYYSDRQVINLDGVVNEDAYHALQDRDTGAYIAREKLEYVVDFQQSLLVGAAGAEEAGVSYEVVATLGAPLDYYDGGLLDVLRVRAREDARRLRRVE